MTTPKICMPSLIKLKTPSVKTVVDLGNATLQVSLQLRLFSRRGRDCGEMKLREVDLFVPDTRLPSGNDGQYELFNSPSSPIQTHNSISKAWASSWEPLLGCGHQPKTKGCGVWIFQSTKGKHKNQLRHYSPGPCPFGTHPNPSQGEAGRLVLPTISHRKDSDDDLLHRQPRKVRAAGKTRSGKTGDRMLDPTGPQESRVLHLSTVPSRVLCQMASLKWMKHRVNVGLAPRDVPG
ncbi:hypothetical protein LX36DRAFT_26587 [Colletotrichum falcatum]|nr:hypothetical protein LX36DRAFT_26587 [Colletotrichum falcatum]